MSTKSIYTDGVTFSELWNASGSIRLLIFKWNLIKNNCKKLSRWTSHVPVNCFSLNSTACQLEAGQSMTDYQSVLVYLLMEKWRLKIEYLTVRDEITQNNHSNIRQNYSFFCSFSKTCQKAYKDTQMWKWFIVGFSLNFSSSSSLCTTRKIQYN